MVKAPLIGSGRCTVCGRSPTVRSHLLPKAFILDARSKNTPHLQVFSKGEKGFETTRGGFFDNNLLCNRHEKALHPIDTYAIGFCRKFDQQRIDIGDTGFHLPVINSDALVRFAASVLWRFSVSKAQAARSVTLDSTWADRLQSVVFDNAACSVSPELIIWRYKSDALDMTKVVYPPSLSVLGGVKCWTLIIKGIAFNLKLDEKSFSGNFGALVINARTSYTSVFKRFEGSQEFYETISMVVDGRRPREHRNRV